MSRPADCPDTQVLRQLLSGQIARPEADRLEDHLARCPMCAAAARRLHQEDKPLSGKLRAPPLTGPSGGVGAPDEGASLPTLPRKPFPESDPPRPESQDFGTRPTLSLLTKPGELLDQLRRLGLLPPAQLEESGRLLPGALSAQDLARELLHRDWLTPYQANQLLQGRGRSLVVGPYHLQARLGAGGMGQVFKARHSRLGRIVALKILHKHREEDPQIVRRFLREVRATVSLRHPNIIQAEDAGDERGMYYLVMEYVEGTDLAQLVKKQGPLPPAQACDCVRQAAIGLQNAWEHGLVHRDLKPNNMLLARDGTVKLLDLGLARLGLTEDQPATTTLTEQGMLMGTPDYIAPEQIRDCHRIDIRADLYSLGCTFYHLLTGRPPFAGESMGAKLLKHQTDEPTPVEELRPEVPAAVGAVVRKLMAKSPADRYQAPADLAEELKRLLQAGQWGPASPYSGLEGQRIEVVGSSWRLWQPSFWSRRRLLQTGLVAGLAVGGAGLALWWTSRAPPVAPRADPSLRGRRRREDVLEQERFDWQPKELVQVLGTHRGRQWGAVYALAMHPNGRQVVSGGMDGSVRFWDLDTLREVEQRPVGEPGETSPSPGRVTGLTFIENGTVLAVGVEAKEDLLRWRLDGSWEEPKEGQALCFSPDGTRALYARGRQVSLFNATTGELLWEIKAGEAGAEYVGVVFSADSRLALCGHGYQCDVLLLDARDPREPRVFKGQDPNSFITAVAFLPEDRFVAVSRDGQVRVWQRDQNKELKRFITFHVTGLAVTRNGETAVAVGPADGLVAMSLTNPASRRQIEQGPSRMLRVVLDAEERRIVTGDEFGQIRIWDFARGKELSPRPSGFRLCQNLTFSPDGSRLAACGSPSLVQVWNVPTGRPEMILTEEKRPTYTGVVFAPDGNNLLVSEMFTAVELIQVDSRAIVQRFRGFETYVRAVTFAPDGRRVYAGGGVDPERMDLKGRECLIRAWDVGSDSEVLRFEGHAAPILGLAVSADGRRLLSCSNTPFDRGEHSIRLWDAATGEQLWKFQNPRYGFLNVTLSADGRWAAAADNEGLVWLWDLEAATSKPRLELKAPAARARAVALTPDGQRLITAGETGRVRVYNRAGDLVGEWRLPGAVSALAVAPDSGHLATANANGTIYILRLPAPPPVKGR